MTTKKPGSSRSSTANGFIDMFLDGLQRAEVIGLLLVLMSAFTLLSLISGSRGALTGAWIVRGVGERPEHVANKVHCTDLRYEPGDVCFDRLVLLPG